MGRLTKFVGVRLAFFSALMALSGFLGIAEHLLGSDTPASAVGRCGADRPYADGTANIVSVSCDSASRVYRVAAQSHTECPPGDYVVEDAAFFGAPLSALDVACLALEVTPNECLQMFSAPQFHQKIFHTSACTRGTYRVRDIVTDTSVPAVCGNSASTVRFRYTVPTLVVCLSPT